jgi:hypothetical protein
MEGNGGTRVERQRGRAKRNCWCNATRSS